MHRTQLLLEEWQYRSLVHLAAKTKKSLSQIIREWITERVRGKEKKIDSADEVIGIIKGKRNSIKISENVDAILYGKKLK